MIDSLFTRLDGMVDALGDVLIANSVYQVVQGNFNRATLTLDSVLRGEPLPKQEVIHTPRSGSGLSHRIIEFLDAAPAPVANWNTNAFQARAQADPILNAWAARRLPDPKRVTCELTNPAGVKRTVALLELELSPLDAIYCGETELRQRVEHLVAAVDGTKIDFTTAADVSFNSFLAITDALAALLAARSRSQEPTLLRPMTPAPPVSIPLSCTPERRPRLQHCARC